MSQASGPGGSSTARSRRSSFDEAVGAFGRGPRLAGFGALALGALAVVAATALGSAAGALDAIVHPPALVRAALVGGSAGLAVILLSRGLTRLAAGTTDVPGLVRGVRLLFLALAAGIAGVGWVVGDPLPLVVALVIAGIDVVETSFLLIVVGGVGLHRQD